MYSDGPFPLVGRRLLHQRLPWFPLRHLPGQSQLTLRLHTGHTHTVLNNTHYPINDTQFIIMLFTTGKKTVFPADRQTDTILLLKLSNTHLISCFTRLFVDGLKQTKSIMRSAAVSLAPALLPKVTLCFT